MAAANAKKMVVGSSVEGGGEDEVQELLVVGSYCHDLLFRDGRLIGETLGGAAAFIANVLRPLLLFPSCPSSPCPSCPPPPSASALASSQSHESHHHRHVYVSKVGPDFAYAHQIQHQHHLPPLLATTSAPTTLFHAHFSSSQSQSPNGPGEAVSGDRLLRRVRACDPILPADLPTARFALGLAVGVAGEIPPDTLARMLDLCHFLIVDVQALIRTFDPLDGTVRLLPLRDTAFYPLLPRIAFLKASAEEAPFIDLDLRHAANTGCRLLITRGKDGCTLCCQDGDFHIPAFPAAVQVDPTGAGDSFLGGFIAGILTGLSVPESALLGNFFGSITVSQIGIPKFDHRMLQRVKQELERRSVHCVRLCGKNVLADFQAWYLDEDFRASLDAAARLTCSYNLIETNDCHEEHQQNLELKSACGAISPIKPS